ncbi:hypothetical protein Nepgr_025757 [Nepenthes gracilis]|uniref:Uncharacterized protein n=1 Tax=Nepenthes gracilis TaxID=150966 RepID=A0AAD3T7M7_NEPGR|nr:hypothetical protein Nepgr_025757 [Nepenthes gracilis]
MAAASTSDAVDWDSDDFELINDDGFVYKRKKRRHGLPSLARPPDPTPDPELLEKQRRERKRKALLKVREKYEREIGLWEEMSNTLRATEQSVKEKQKQDTQGFEQEKKKQQEEGEGGESSAVGKQGDCGSLIDDLLLQVEAQEAIIHQVTNLCDVAEALCDGQEQKMNQSFIDLPIWGSPRELMALLCDD